MKKKLLIGLAVVAISIQFFPAPAKTNPPTHPNRTFAAVMKPPAPLLRILQRACYDCHSHETQWPWYASIAPVSWPVRQHVVDGRKHVNFSEWIRPGETKFSAWSDMEEICTSVNLKQMPLKGYDWMHPAAKLSDGDRKAVCAWVDSQISGAP